MLVLLVVSSISLGLVLGVRSCFDSSATWKDYKEVFSFLYQGFFFGKLSK